MLNINEMSADDRMKTTTAFVLNIGRTIQANLSGPEGNVGDKIEGELRGYRDDHLIVRVKHGSAKSSHGNVRWPFLMLDNIHFPERVT